MIAPGEGEVVGDSADRRVEILSDHDALHATWSRFGPHREGAELHVHHRHTDLFFVLAGELTIRLGTRGHEVPAPAGTLVRVPPGVVHGFRNGGDAELCYLNLHAPGRGFADYMRAMRDGRALSYDQHDPPADGGRPDTEAVIGEPHADVEDIAVALCRSEPAAAPPPRSAGPLASFYVLDGELAVTAGGRELRAPAGAWVQVPEGAAHAVAAAGPEPARYLELLTPRASGRAERPDAHPRSRRP